MMGRFRACYSSLRDVSLLTLAGWLTVFTPIGILLGRAVPDITLSLIAILFLVESLKTKNFSWVKEPWILSILCLWLYSILQTAVVGAAPDGMERALGWGRFALFGVALARWVLVDEVWRKRLISACIAVTGFLAVDACLQYVIGFDVIGRPMLGNRLTSIFEAPKVGINVSWLFFPLMIALLTQGKRLASLLFGAVCFTAILLSGDRFALISALCLFVLFPLFVPRFRKAAALCWLALILTSGALMALSPEIYNRQIVSTVDIIRRLPDTHYGIIWISALDIFAHQPLLGFGMRGYRFVCENSEFGPHLIGPDQLTRCVMHPHNLYLEWMVDTGLVGLLGFLTFAFFLFRDFYRGLRRAAFSNTLLLAIVLTVFMRFWPITSSASFFTSWTAVTFWLLIGWGMAVISPRR